MEQMDAIARAVIGLIALLHVYILVLEMFLWTTPFGQKTFRRSREEQEQTKVLAANQGLYNGFLAAGLCWSAIASDGASAFPLRAFFLGCVVVAGLYGGATATRRIFFVQALPGAIGLVLAVLVRA
jgi:putative membrane protein